jgi:shikimate dehydrogenase
MSSPALQEIIALLGCPAAGNPAQYLYERAIEAAALDWRFVSCDVAATDAAAAVAGVAALGFRGAVLSGPLRAAAGSLVATATPAAAFSQGVSLIERSATGLVGHMTDGRGLVEALRAHCDPAATAAVVVGAGMTGRAAALELALAGATRLVICDPDAAEAAALVNALSGVGAGGATAADWTSAIVVPDDAGIVVLAAPAAFAEVRGDLVVADALLGPQPSRAARQAANGGACLVDGLEIHAAQTAIDFHTLTGVETDADMLREALEEFLS